MDEKNEEGLSIGEFFKMVWSQKILALIIVVAVTLVGTLGLYFGYNALTEEYSVTYRMSFPDLDNFLSDYTYPDGRVFYYTSVASASTVEQVKATDDRFKDIDSNAFSIVYEYEELSSTTTTAGTTVNAESSFTITARSSAFPNAEVARDFFIELANSPVKYFAQIDYDYHSTLKSYLSAKNDDYTNYDSLLTMLENQLKTLQTAYNYFVDADPLGLGYSPSFALVDSDGNQTTLGAYKSEVDSYLESGVIGTMRAYARQQNLVKSQKVKDNMPLQKIDLADQLAAAELTLENLTKATNMIGEDANFVDILIAQTELVSSLKQQQAAVDSYISSGVVNTEYMTTVEGVYTRLDELTTELEEVTKQINEKVAAVAFSSSTIMETNNLNFGICFAISFVVGLIAAVIAGYCVAASKEKKALATATEAPTVEEAKPSDKE